MPYEPPTRNTAGVRHERVRQYVDNTFGKLHDVVSEAYYENKDLVIAGHNFGTLSDAQFETIHPITHDVYELGFHRVNLYLAANYAGYTKIPEDDYRFSTNYDENGNVIETIDTLAPRQTDLQDFLAPRPAVANYDFTINDPVTGGTRQISLNDLATFTL